MSLDPDPATPGAAAMSDAPMWTAMNVPSVQHNRESVQRTSVPRLLVAQAQRTPENCALVCGPWTMTYRELDAASNRLARALRLRGLAPGTRIAVSLDRSIELVVALLAVLKAGSAYIPLDPHYPRQRLAHVIDNARPAAILVRTARDPLPGTSVPLVALDGEAHTIDAHSGAPLDDETDGEQPAYVIYTSGSTGVPKGVEVPHRAVVNLLESMRIEPGLTAADALLAVTTISFDIAVLEIFLPLIVGARLILARESECRDGAAFREMLERHRPTVLQATPVSWQMLLEAGWRGDAGLKMLCGGEAMTRPLANALLSRGRELWNMYGPTETTVWSSALRVTHGEGPVPLGPPIANTRFHVLDASMRSVRAGESGELFIGGDGVARGYFGLPALTAQKFLHDPFSSVPGARLYRTGDIVRIPLEGAPQCLEYLGRADHQLKLRGFRIEPGEIESILVRDPAISQAVAVAQPSPSGETVLCAYVVLRNTGAGELPEKVRVRVRSSFAAALPEYMHPAVIVALDAMPLTPNGKIDRKALPSPWPDAARVRPDNTDSPAALPRDITPVQARLAAIWQSVLGVAHVAPSANFFALGGTSLLAARLLLRLESEFGVRLSLAALLGAPTLTQQAALLGQRDGRQYDFRRVARLHASGSRPPLIAIHNTGVHYYNLAQILGDDQPLTALQLFDPSTPRSVYPCTVEAIAAEYVDLIRQQQPTGPYQLLGWCVGGVLAFEIAHQLQQRRETVAFVGVIDSWAPDTWRRMSRLRAWLAHRSYRLQLIRSDWRRVMAGQQRLRDFLSHRVLVQRVMRLLGAGEPERRRVAFDERHQSTEHYDLWLDAYLDEVSARHTPRPCDRVPMLLWSSRDHRGWCLDPRMGWGPHVPAGIDVTALEGDHFTVFQGAGLARMAATLRAVLAGRAPGVEQAGTPGSDAPDNPGLGVWGTGRG
ncbi:MAG TPA: amino acid adenylation domain-containing protein [Povalibacter sp.]|nr:amino acid adenylation domain-containing protein [Povalibacter sp.]